MALQYIPSAIVSTLGNIALWESTFAASDTHIADENVLCKKKKKKRKKKEVAEL